MKLFKPCYMVLNVEQNKVLPPTKIGRCWFRGYYDTQLAAKRAIILLEKNIKDGWIKPATFKVIEVTEVN